MNASKTATKEQVYVNTSVRTVGSLVILGIQLIAMVVLSRLLPVSAFGAMAYAMVFVGFADLASQLGVGPALIQKRSLTDREIRAGFTLSLCFGLLVAILLVVLAPFVVNDATTVSVLRALSLLFLFVGISVVSSALLQREHRFGELVVIECVSYFVGYLVVSIGLAIAGFGVWSLVWGVLANVGLRSIAYWSRVRHPLRFLFSWGEMKPLLRFGMFFTFTRGLNFAASTGDAFLVGRLLGNDLLGLYSRAFLLIRLPAQIVTRSMHAVLFPVLSRIDDKETVARTYYQSTMFALCLMAPLSCTVLVTAPELVVIPFGAKWSGAVLPLQILAAVAVLGTFTLGDALLKSADQLQTQLVVHVVYCASLLLGIGLLCGYGIAGVAVGVLIANVIMYCLMTFICARYLRATLADLVKTHTPAILIATVILITGISVRSVMMSTQVSLWIVWLSTSIACCIAFAIVSFVPIGGALGDYQSMLAQYLTVMDGKTRSVRTLLSRRFGMALSAGEK